MKKFFKSFKPPKEKPVAKTGVVKQNDIDYYYYIGKQLGSGAFGDVRIATRKSDNLQFAVKCIEKSKLKGKEEMIKDEMEILSKVHHPNLITLVEKFENANFIYLVTDLALGGELFDQIIAREKYSEKDASVLIVQILEGVKYLHEMDIVHRDLKPENLLFADRTETSRLLITDFGLSKTISAQDMLTTQCGTPAYVAPEILTKSGHGKPVDCWAIGVMSYVLLCGYTPFYGEDQISTYQAIIAGDFEFDEEYWSEVSDSAKSFIKGLLTVDQTKRLTVHQALQHPWITKDAENKTSDLLPKVRANFNGKKTFKKAVQGAMAMHRLKALSSKSLEVEVKVPEFVPPPTASSEEVSK
ncbi:Calcium/calmodulin-dependent protein kinase type 1 [Nowakowskiella sp. JEL0407]|nr:Calcium/calmodulin-dependent protein kinase type 1 [Nowakowskiella sp. JEL0407]